MATLEMVEKLRERADVTFDEAKTALDQSDNDLLEALIYLEKNGKATPPNYGGFYSSQYNEEPYDRKNRFYYQQDSRSKRGRHKKKNKYNQYQEQEHNQNVSNFFKKLGAFLGKALYIGNRTTIEVLRNGQLIFGLPLTILVIFLAFFFQYIFLAVVISLFCGVRYRVNGDAFNNEPINSVMDSAANAAESLKDNIKNSN